MRLLVVAAVVALGAAALASKEKSYDGDFLFEEDDWKTKKEKPAVKTWIWDPESGLCSALECRSSEMCLLEDSFTAVCVSRAELKTNGDRIVSRQLAEDEHLVASEPWSDLDDDAYDDDDEYDDEDDEDEIDLDEDEDEDEYDYDEDEEDEEEEWQEEEEGKGDDEDFPAEKERKKDKACRECPYTHPSVATYICGTDNRTYSSLCRLEQHNCIHGSFVTTDCKGFCPCKEPGSYRRRKQKLRDNAVRTEPKAPRKSAKSKLKSKYDKHHQEMKKFNNVKYYPKHADKSYKHHPKCTKSELESMGSRLLDWFVVLKSSNAGAKHVKHHKYYDAHVPSSCRPTTRWMFQYLDTDSDGQLTQSELFAVERDEHERCLKPFLDTCDLNGDLVLSGREWCQCFKPIPVPCKERRAGKNRAARLGAYRAACDEDGFYRATQCEGSQCWCVDRYGTEIRGSRASRGHTRCHGDTDRASDDFNAADEDDEDNYVIEGSGEGGPQEF